MGKIAVFTVFRNTNYGAVLQACALTRVLRQLSGQEVFLIDYIRDQNTNLMHNGIVFHGRHGRKTINLQSLKKTVKSLANYSGTVKRTREFLKFIDARLPIFPHPFYAGDPIRLDGFDCCFLGSDQIWNPGIVRKFHDAYFGFTTPRLGRVVAYAPSLGRITFNEKEKLELARKLENVDVLSCREKNSCVFLEQLTGRRVAQVLDPALLLTCGEWNEYGDANCKLPPKYVLVYSLQFDKWLMNQAMEFARAKGLEVLLLGRGNGIPPRGVRYERAFGPGQFLSAVSHAECVYTDSYHGNVFSVVFGKRFVVRAHGEKGQRMESLCGALGLSSRVFREPKDIPDIGMPIDYRTVHACLAELRKASLDYIAHNLSLGQSIS